MGAQEQICSEERGDAAAGESPHRGASELLRRNG